MSLENAKDVIGHWREDYQTLRLNRGLGGLKPEDFRVQKTEYLQDPVAL